MGRTLHGGRQEQPILSTLLALRNVKEYIPAVLRALGWQPQDIYTPARLSGALFSCL